MRIFQIFKVWACLLSATLLSACFQSGEISDLTAPSTNSKVALTLDQTNLPLTEGSSSAIVLLLSAPRNVSTTIHLGLSSVDGDTSSGAFDNFPSSVTVPAGSQSLSIVLNPTNDLIYRGLRSFVIRLSSSDPEIQVTAQLNVSISDNDGIPKISFSSPTQNVYEDDGSKTASLTLDHASAFPITVAYSAANGTGTQGTDYTFTNGSVTFAPYEISKTLPFQLIDQSSVAQGNKTFQISLGSITGEASLDTVSSQTVTILDRQTTSLSVANVNVNEGSSTSVTVSLSTVSASNVSFHWETVDASAIAGTDYTSASGDITVLAGSTSATITVSTLDTAGICQADRTFKVRLSSPVGAAIASNDGVVTIKDPDRPTVSLTNASGNEGTSISVTATLSAACPLNEVTFNWSTSNVTATSASGDYTAVSSTAASIAAGSTSVALPVATSSNAVYEGNETFSVAISSPTGASLGTPSSATVTILETTSIPTVQFAAATSSALESDGTMTVTVNQSGISEVATTIPFTLGGTASSSTDFTAPSPLSVTIAAGQTSVDISIPLTNDSTIESDETIILTLGTPTNATAGSTAAHTLTVINEDVGAFTISGITGSSDIVADADLNGGVIPTINWGTSTGAQSYDVRVLANDGITVICPLENTTSTSLTFSVPCTLTAGTTYKVEVKALSAAGTRTAASNSLYSFFVNRAPTPVNDGPFFLLSGGSITIDVTADNPVTGASDPDSDPDGHTLTLASATNGSNGTTSISGTQITYTPNASFLGADSVTYTVSDGHGATATATLSLKVVALKEWTGAVGTGNWSDAGNWCGGINAGKTGCTAASSAPGSSDTAVFSVACGSGSACNAQINANITVANLKLTAGYTGTLTQAATRTLTVGTSFTQSGGTFQGGNSTITFTGTYTLSGGDFYSTSGTLVAPGTFTISSATSFHHNNGKVQVGGNSTFNTDQVSFYNLDAVAWSGTLNLSNKTITVENDLKCSSTNSQIVNSGTVNIKGNLILVSQGCPGTALFKLNGTNPQTIDASAGNVTHASYVISPITNLPGLEIASSSTVSSLGNFLVRNNYKYTSGTISFGTSYWLFASEGTIFQPGSPTYPNVAISGWSTTYDLGGATWKIGNLVIGNETSATSASRTLNNGTIEVTGDLTLGGFGAGGTALIDLVGTNQQISVTNPQHSPGGSFLGAAVPSLRISSSGTVTATGTILVNRAYTWAGTGSLSASSSTWVFLGVGSPALTPGDQVYGTVGLTGWLANFTLNGTMKTADFYCGVSTTDSTAKTITGGTFEIYGNTYWTGASCRGSVALKFAGSTSSTLSVHTTVGSNYTSGPITVSKSGGASLSINSSMNWNGSSQDLTVDAGSILSIGSGATVTIGRHVTNNGTINTNGTTCGSLAFSGTYSGNAQTTCP